VLPAGKVIVGIVKGSVVDNNFIGEFVANIVLVC